MNKLLLIIPLLIYLFFSSCGNSSNSKSIPNIESKNKEKEKLKELTDSLNSMRSELENLKNPISSDSLGDCSVPSDESYFKSVRIGNQTWMVENLNVTRFRNGDPIPEAKSNREWEDAARSEYAAFCYTPGGVLYNWYAVSDFRGLAPKGWHIPNSDEWEEIIDFLGGKEAANVKMKSKMGWSSGSPGCGNGTNSSGFSGFPLGGRWEIGDYDDKGYSGWWWSSNKFSFELSFTDYGCFIKTTNALGAGLSVRCIKD
jgi:uncharacterized protein (TIGR02145 family)